MNKIVIAGGTGFVGQYLSERFRTLGYHVIIIGRRPGNILWTDRSAISDSLENAAMLINLAGKSVNCRYNEKNKAEIFSSRTATTTLLGELIAGCTNPPKLWLNASTATIYRHAEDRPMTESSGEIGRGFSVDVATLWEKTFFDFKSEKTRQVALRMAIVLGADGGVILPFKNLVRAGLGGIQGNGRQYFSWIHIEDLFQLILFLKGHEDLYGVVNCAAPNPIMNKTFMATFRQVMNRKIGLPSPKWLLEIGAALIGTETELLLKSRWVLPERLENSGFTFQFPTISTALQDILQRE
ncbi:TIGR01777 family oxidoreductase [Sphingobacterium sp. UGAL515B_05]|uniref:TIGR01777 family oxidoreductase n=1 Tax=Sphingobacterium sp. UGAL515B_05 TaxID=2986767 RepID=UPI0029557EF9|nr:TIGR01777 family oxidoreductase [Sphingobacterium sp. UGAL515B_05]WON95724.1 TIGR01777 family oxidoreductase [Sphingobacterium sp. UGAL515B_05]